MLLAVLVYFEKKYCYIYIFAQFSKKMHNLCVFVLISTLSKHPITMQHTWKDKHICPFYNLKLYQGLIHYKFLYQIVLCNVSLLFLLYLGFFCFILSFIVKDIKTFIVTTPIPPGK